MRVTYNSRLASDGVIEKIKRTGKFDGFTFAARYDPCKSFFQKLQSVFHAASRSAPNEINVAVTMSANFPGLSRTGERLERGHERTNLVTLCNKTDAPIFQMLDPESLEPIGLATQTTLHPALKGPGSAAHARSDPVTGHVFNYNLDFGRTGTYRVFRVSAATGQTSILATISYAPAYLHSLFLTENYVVLCIWNSLYRAGGLPILWHQNLLDAMTWDGSRPTTWFVVDKRPPEEGGKGVVAKFESEPFFSFHTINAYEDRSSAQDGTVDIVADIAAYENIDCISHFYLDNLISDSPAAKAYGDSSNTSAQPNYRRFRLPSVPSTPTKKTLKAVAEYTSSKADTPELPTLNPRVVTKKHRYIYGINGTGKSSFVDGLIKYDTETHSVTRWGIHGHTAGEPIFVADPASTEEDAGVLLSVVLDGVQGKSYLLVLDAKTMKEVGRAHVNGVIGFGFHGFHVKTDADVGGLNGLYL